MSTLLHVIVYIPCKYSINGKRNENIVSVLSFPFPRATITIPHKDQLIHTDIIHITILALCCSSYVYVMYLLRNVT